MCKKLIGKETGLEWNPSKGTVDAFDEWWNNKIQVCALCISYDVILVIVIVNYIITIFFFTIKFTISIAKRDIIIATNNPPLPILGSGIPL